jgi:hypothetical protein
MRIDRNRHKREGTCRPAGGMLGLALVGWGPCGGRFSVSETEGGYRFGLQDLRWAEDLAVSGTVELPRRSGAAHAALRLAGAGQFSGTLEPEWPEGQPLARAQVRGRIGAQTVAAEAPAP